MAKLRGCKCRLPLTLAKCLLSLHEPQIQVWGQLALVALPSPLGSPLEPGPRVGCPGERSAPFPLTPCYQAGLEEIP